MLAQFLPGGGGKERYCKFLNKRAAQRVSQVIKGFGEPYNSFFLFHRKELLLLVCFVVGFGTSNLVSEGSIRNMVGQCSMAN